MCVTDCWNVLVVTELLEWEYIWRGTLAIWWARQGALLYGNWSSFYTIPFNVFRASWTADQWSCCTVIASVMLSATIRLPMCVCLLHISIIYPSVTFCIRQKINKQASKQIKNKQSGISVLRSTVSLYRRSTCNVVQLQVTHVLSIH